MGAKRIVELEIDAHDWVRDLKLEYYRVADLRKLRVGEMFWVAYFGGPGVSKQAEGHCEAYIERVRGGYRFNAVWTIVWQGNLRRSHIMTFGGFDLLKGNLIRFKSQRDVDAVASFKRVCRYVHFIERHAKELGFERYIGAPYHVSRLWHCETVLSNGCTKFGVPGPEPHGLGAIVETAIALGVVPTDEEERDEVPA